MTVEPAKPPEASDYAMRSLFNFADMVEQLPRWSRRTGADTEVMNLARETTLLYSIPPQGVARTSVAYPY